MQKEDILLKYLTAEEKELLNDNKNILSIIEDQLAQEENKERKAELEEEKKERIKIIFRIEDNAFKRCEEDLAADPDAMLKDALAEIEGTPKEKFDKWHIKEKQTLEYGDGSTETFIKDPHSMLYWQVNIYLNAAFMIKHTENNSFYYDEIEKAVDKKCKEWGYTSTAEKNRADIFIRHNLRRPEYYTMMRGSADENIIKGGTPHISKGKLEVTNQGTLKGEIIASAGDSLFSQSLDGQIHLIWAINQAGKKKKSEVLPVYIAMSLQDSFSEELKIIKNGRVVNRYKYVLSYDIDVLNAIVTLWEEWKKENTGRLYFTIKEIWAIMNGLSPTTKQKPTPKQEQGIKNSIEKLRHIDIDMNITAELQKKVIKLNDERLTAGHIKDFFLNVTEVSFMKERSGEVVGYVLNTEPLLYTYDKAKGHIAYIPFQYLETSIVVNSNARVYAFRQYLLRQISLLSFGYRSNNRILLETIYKDTGTPTPEEQAENMQFDNEKKKQKHIRELRNDDNNKIKGLLTFWEVKGLIKKYIPLNKDGEEVKEKQKIYAYEIQVNKKAMLKKN